jgi:hypothetical protein
LHLISSWDGHRCGASAEILRTLHIDWAVLHRLKNQLNFTPIVRFERLSIAAFAAGAIVSGIDDKSTGDHDQAKTKSTMPLTRSRLEQSFGKPQEVAEGTISLTSNIANSVVEVTMSNSS